MQVPKTPLEWINAFDQLVETNYLPASSQLLWYKLLGLFNRSMWAEWIEVDNQKLMALIQCKREASFLDYRNKLIQAGLLDYIKGKKGVVGKYRLTFTSVYNPVCNSVYNPVCNSVYNTEDTYTTYPTDTPYTNTNTNTLVQNACDDDGISAKRDGKTTKAKIADFDVFWKEYPKKIGKGSAKKSWEKIKPDEELLSMMLITLEKARKSKDWQKDNGQYIPHPTTWLNQQRWLDEYEQETDIPPEIPNGRRKTF